MQLVSGSTEQRSGACRGAQAIEMSLAPSPFQYSPLQQTTCLPVHAQLCLEVSLRDGKIPSNLPRILMPAVFREKQLPAVCFVLRT